MWGRRWVPEADKRLQALLAHVKAQLASERLNGPLNEASTVFLDGEVYRVVPGSYREWEEDGG